MYNIKIILPDIRPDIFNIWYPARYPAQPYYPSFCLSIYPFVYLSCLSDYPPIYLGNLSWIFNDQVFIVVNRLQLPGHFVHNSAQLHAKVGQIGESLDDINFLQMYKMWVGGRYDYTHLKLAKWFEIKLDMLLLLLGIRQMTIN